MDSPPVGERVEGGPARPPERRRLEGRYVALEPVLPAAHAEALWRAAHDGSVEAPATWTYMPYGPFRDSREMGAWLEEIASSEDPLFLVVVGRDGPVGMASFLNADVEMRRVELGHIWYGPRARHTEANTESAYLMLRESFERLGNRRVEWKCDVLNERSRAAALRLGSRSRACSATTWSSRTGTATPPGSRCSRGNGRPRERRSNDGSLQSPTNVRPSPRFASAAKRSRNGRWRSWLQGSRSPRSRRASSGRSSRATSCS